MSTADDPPKPKRSLFNRPAWAQDTSTAKPESSDVFSRSHNYQDVIAERERQRREKAKKKAEKVKRRSESFQEDSSNSSAKRRRVSDDAESDLVIVDSAEKSDDDEEFRSKAHRIGSTVDKISRQYERVVDARKTRSTPKDIITLGDSSDDEPVHPPGPPPSSTQSGAQAIEDDDDDESDPEFRELARKARENRRREEQQRQEHEQRSGTPADSYYTTPAIPFDPVVQLFITSQIPDTSPLIVGRKLSQRLQEVREAWCKKQNFSPEFSATVFFTYQLRKTYDVTTCKSLGVKVDCYGKVIPDVLDPFREIGEHDTKIHIEAVTPELWEELKAKKTAKGRRGRPDAYSEDNTPAFGGADEEQEEVREEATIKLLLKAKGFKDLKVKVRPVSHPHHIMYRYES